VYSVLLVSLDCHFLNARVVRHLVYPVLLVSLDCPFLSARVVPHLVYPVLLVAKMTINTGIQKRTIQRN
jgi:hypothetical protein